MIRYIVFFSCLLGLASGAQAAPEALYSEHCASCHGADRLGGIGPALIPETLKRMRGPKLSKVIAEGRAATQMPGFSETLTPEEIAALTEFVKVPLAKIPDWGPAEIMASRKLDLD